MLVRVKANGELLRSASELGAEAAATGERIVFEAKSSKRELGENPLLLTVENFFDRRLRSTG